ncbi:hypothetical protein [Actinoplanes sp. NPDC049316]|uniref:hypothetical protein n=1 Tax=Actinoplanes sp. NPDC049316 TaxID=3154727 RepID=UPI003430FEC3
MRTTFWQRRLRRNREQILAAAHEWQEQERAAAYARIAGLAVAMQEPDAAQKQTVRTPRW